MKFTKKIDTDNPKILIRYIIIITSSLLLLFIILNILKINVLEINTYNSNYKTELLYQNKINSVKKFTITKTNLVTKKEYTTDYLIDDNFYLKLNINSKIYSHEFKINDIKILKAYPLETFSSLTIKSKEKSLLEYIFLDAELLVKN